MIRYDSCGRFGPKLFLSYGVSSLEELPNVVRMPFAFVRNVSLPGVYPGHEICSSGFARSFFLAVISPQNETGGSLTLARRREWSICEIPHRRPDEKQGIKKARLRFTQKQDIRESLY